MVLIFLHSIKSLNHLNFAYKKTFLLLAQLIILEKSEQKEVQNADKIFLSSLFKSNHNYLGINKFKLLSKRTKRKVVALGGISKKQYKKT